MFLVIFGCYGILNTKLDRYIAKMSPEKLISENDIINRLQFYYKKGLIYHSNDFKEII